MPSPDISVVIPTFNRLDRITRVLAALDRQTYPREAFEIVVVSDGSTDGTDELLRSVASTNNLRPVFQANRGPAAARNAGVRSAAGELIVFVDDDVVPKADFLAAHRKAQADADRKVAVIGPLLTPDDFRLSPWVDWEQAMLIKQYDAMTRGLWQPTARQFYTGNASIRRDILVQAGGFDESFRRAEDVELAYRLAASGVSFVFTMAPVGLHYAERSFASWLDTAHQYGRNDAIFARDRGQDWLLPVVRAEFGYRKWPLRMLISACLRRPALAAGFVPAFRGLAAAAGAVRIRNAESAAYSALFGLRYYQGFLDEIGQPDILFASAPRSTP